jgi:outer membrane immunogenic protein
MKKILMTTVALAAFGLSAPASAADLGSRMYTKAPAPVAAMYNWSGLYIGANAGWGRSENCGTMTGAFGPFLVGGGISLPDGCHDADGGTFGAQIGYRWQMNSWVFGIEAQGNWADFEGSSISTQLPALTNQTEINSFGMITGQVGYAWNNALLYVKGGAAVARYEYTGIIGASGAEFDTAKDTQWGGVLGVGLEYGFAPNWSIGIEYAHVFMGDRDVSFDVSPAFGGPGVFRTETFDGDIDLVTLRLNYRFGR